MQKLLLITVLGYALVSCSDRGAYTAVVNASAHPVDVNYIDTSDARLRTVTVLPGRQVPLSPNRRLSDLTLLEFETAGGGLVFNNFRATGPRINCSGDCRIIWMDNHKVKFLDSPSA